MNKVKVNNVALVPIVVAIAAFVCSPDFYNLLPDHAAHIIAGLALVASTLFPQLFKKHDQERKEDPAP